MDTDALLAPDTGAPLGRSRGRVLDLLRASSSPVGVQEVAERVGLHPNTARFHLEGLAEAGLATRAPRLRGTPGRPSMAYRASADDTMAGGRRYRLLAEMLTGLVSASMPEPAKAAEEAGREWGAYLAEQPPPYHRPDLDEAVEKLTAVLSELGFAPQAASDGRGLRVRLHQCPFQEVARRHQDIVCALHLGLMRGALARMRAPLTAKRLEPFAGPNLCVAHLAPGS